MTFDTSNLQVDVVRVQFRGWTKKPKLPMCFRLAYIDNGMTKCETISEVRIPCLSV